MRVNVKLFASLRTGRFDAATFDLSDGSTVAAALEAASVSEAEAAIIFVNSRHAESSSGLEDGDVLAVFPPVGGG